MTSETKVTPSPTHRKRFWLSIILGTGFLLYLAMAGLLLPRMLTQKLPGMMSEKLQRPVTLEEIRMNPFTLRGVVSGFAIGEDPKLAGVVRGPFFKIEALTIDLDPIQSLISWGVCLDRFEIKGPFISLYRDGSQYNFDSLAAALIQPGASKAPADEEKQIPKLRIKAFSVQGGSFCFKEKRGNQFCEYPANNELNFSATNFVLGKGKNPVMLRFKGPGGGLLTLNMQLGISPLDMAGELAIEKTDLRKLSLFFDDKIPANLTRAMADIHTDFFVRATDSGFAWGSSNGKIEFNKLELTHHGDAFITVERFSLDQIQTDSVNRSLSMGPLVLDDWTVKMVLEKEGNLDLVSYFSPSREEGPVALEPSKTAPKDDSAETQWGWSLAGITLTNGRIHFTDRMVQEQVSWKLVPITLTTGPLDHEMKTPIPVTLGTRINETAPLDIEGEVDGKTGNTRAHVGLKDLDLGWVLPYTQSSLRLKKLTGKCSVAGRVALEAHPFDTRFKGDISIAGLGMYPPKGNAPFAQWEKMDVTALDLTTGGRQLKVASVKLNGPVFRVIKEDGGRSNLSEITAPPRQGKTQDKKNEKTTGEKKESPAPFRVGLDKFTVKDGALFFSDLTVSPAFRSSIESVNGSIKGLSSERDMRAVVDIAGKADRYAPVSLTGTLNPFLKSPEVDLDLTLNLLEMTAFSPYAATYGGYGIDRGLLEANLDYTIQNRYLRAGNKVVIRKLELGEYSNSPKATALPVKLAIALIEDTQGVIDMDVPVSGNLDDPNVSVGGLVLKAFVNVLVKAISSPFALVGGLLGESDTRDYIAFAPGDNRLSKENRDQLKTVVDGLKKRPKLRLILQGSASPAQDGKALARKKLSAALANQLNIPTPELAPVAELITEPKAQTALEALYQSALGKTPDTILKAAALPDEAGNSPSEEEIRNGAAQGIYQALMVHYHPSDEQLGLMAYNRSKVVKAFLVETGQIDAARIYLKQKKAEAVSGEAGVKMQLGVE